MNKEEKNDLFSGLTDRLEKKDAVFMLDGPITVTVKLKDNTYRTKPIGRENFYLAEIYQGQKDLLFVFMAEEIIEANSDYVAIEVADKKMDDAFPMFLAEMKDWARDTFVPRDASRLQPILNAESVKALVNMAVNFEEADRAVADTSGDESLATLPMFGMF